VNVCVVGCWHLGSVTAGCVASFGHHVVGIDPDPSVVEGLGRAEPPVAEPGLPELLAREIDGGRLTFSDARDARDALGDADVVWITFDTPVGDDDRPYADWVVTRVDELLPAIARDALVLVSSQLPVGSVSALERRAREQVPRSALHFATSPENLRLGSAIEAFLDPPRVVVGVRDHEDRARIGELLGPLANRIVWMSVESAEMTKHALNAFLATCVSFANELAVLCERVGADARDVAAVLRSDPRVGPRAYVTPGAAFAGGTLGRDVTALAVLGHGHGLDMHVIEGVRGANDAHGRWALGVLEHGLGELRGRTVAILGLTYKPGTDTLRRSAAIDLARALAERGASVRAHDPMSEPLPADVAAVVQRCESPSDAAAGADAIVVMTEWPEYRELDAAALTGTNRPLVVDASGFLAASLGGSPRVEYRAVGW